MFRLGIASLLFALLPTIVRMSPSSSTVGPEANSLPGRRDFNAGESINIFSSYGYLREGFHILPVNSSDPWVINLPTSSPLRDVPTLNGSLDHRGDIEFEFCSGPKQLLRAFFRHFSIDGIPRVWNSFLIGWDRDTFAKSMGIKKHFLSNAYGYVLVRIIRRDRRGSLRRAEGEDGIVFTDSVEEDVARIVVGDEASVLRFFQAHGTHYVSSYTAGGLMYQVYAYSRKKFAKVIVELEKKTVSKWSKSFFNFVFSPWYSDHAGEVMVTGGDATIRQWMQRNLNASFFIYTHQSLLNIYWDEKLMHDLATLLGDDVVVELDLKTLLPAIKDAGKRSWAEEILMNRLALWDIGI